MINLIPKTYIQIYDNALSKHECKLLIDEFEKSDKTRGFVNKNGKYVEDVDEKKCIQLDNPKLNDSGINSNILKPIVWKYIDKYYHTYKELLYNPKWHIDYSYSFQKYESDDDGYKEWHCEHGTLEASRRMLAWMIYLNDAKSGTEFFNYSKIKAKQGRLVIWPAFWTHVHRSEPNRGLKYLVTGWAHNLD